MTDAHGSQSTGTNLGICILLGVVVANARSACIKTADEARRLLSTYEVLVEQCM